MERELIFPGKYCHGAGEKHGIVARVHHLVIIFQFF